MHLSHLNSYRTMAYRPKGPHPVGVSDFSVIARFAEGSLGPGQAVSGALCCRWCTTVGAGLSRVWLTVCIRSFAPGPRRARFLSLSEDAAGIAHLLAARSPLCKVCVGAECATSHTRTASKRQHLP